MRLGLTDATYQYLFGGDGFMFQDRTSGEYDWRGLPLPYFTQTPTTVREPSPEIWMINRAHEFGLEVAHLSIRDWTPGHVEEVVALLAQNGQELMPAIPLRVMLEGDEFASELEDLKALFARYVEIGAKIAKTCVFPMTYNRFRRDVPLSAQLAKIKASIAPIVEAAENTGLVLALENHLDYRASEILEIIEEVDSPYLRFLFDTGNPFSVCEEPVDAAKLAAPYTALVHIKDVRVLPWTPLAPGYFACMYACPLGEGNVDLHEILEIMSAQAPNAGDLTLSLEITPIPPYADEDQWLEAGVAYMRKEFGGYLTGHGPGC